MYYLEDFIHIIKYKKSILHMQKYIIAGRYTVHCAVSRNS